jgi:hypothetical protein
MKVVQWANLIAFIFDFIILKYHIFNKKQIIVNDINKLTLKIFPHSAPLPSTSFPRKRESRGVAHEAMTKLLLTCPWIPGQARNDNSEGYGRAKEECLFIYVVHYSFFRFFFSPTKECKKFFS